MTNSSRAQAGFSLLEILLVIAILAIIAMFVFTSMISYARFEQLRASTTELETLINETRQRTLSAESTGRYGLYFATSSVVFFEGDGYTGNNPTNATTTFVGLTLSTNFPGTTTKQIIFTRLTGTPSATGTITLTQSVTNSTTSLTIVPSGLVE